MIIDKNNYIEIQEDLLENLNDIATTGELDSLTQHIESKLSKFKPTIMIYGTYNSGKSTLLNALFGQEELAKTGDAPETKEVHEYEYNGYTIFDTPGLNANSADDLVSKEHLSKSEVVIFVLSTNGSLEEDYVYAKISEVIKANKPIILVLNNKNGIEPVSIEAEELMSKVRGNLIKIGDRNAIENIETKVNLCMVNAKTALKAKLETKNLILKKSNILELEMMIEKLLEATGNQEVINTLNLYLQNFINMLIERIDNKIDNDEVKKIEELITYLEKLKQSSEIKLKNTVSKKMPALIDNITTIILSEDASENDINSYISETIEDINNEVMIIYKNIESNLAIKIDDFTQEFKSINSDSIAINISDRSTLAEASSVVPEEIQNKISETLRDKKVLEAGTKGLLTKAKDWLPKNAMHGKGPVWIEKAAGKAAIGITVALEAYNIYSAHKEHQQMINEERNRTLGAKNKAESIASNIQSSLFNSIDEVIVDTFNNLILKFKDASKSLNNNNRSLLQKKENIQIILNRF